MKRHLPTLLLAACALLFAGTFYTLLRGRFEKGNVYPASSSLRSDPLGTMIFYESLSALPGVRVERDHSAVNRLPQGKGTTYFQFGAGSSNWNYLSPETYRIVERFLLDGGRLVVTLDPEFIRKHKWDEETEKDKKDEKDSAKEDGGAKKEETASKEESAEKNEAPEKKDEAEPKKVDPEKSDAKETASEKPGSKKDSKKRKKKRKDYDSDYVSLADKWGLRLEQKSASPDGKSIARNVSASGLPGEYPWHGDVVIKDPGPEWTVLYKNDAGPVIAERKRGAGTIVIVTDSYLVSNEALVKDRQPALLAWLAGSGTSIVFDEAHHGIMESPGIASLARKYRLYGGAAALLILAGLFIWKNSSSLSPTRATGRAASDVIEGRNASAGFISLLRRNIPIDRILDVCMDEWRKSFSRSSKYTPKEKSAVEAIVQAEAVLPPRDRNAADAYEKIRKTLHRKAPQRPA
jgi:hypothetical protein